MFWSLESFQLAEFFYKGQVFNLFSRRIMVIWVGKKKIGVSHSKPYKFESERYRFSSKNSFDTRVSHKRYQIVRLLHWIDCLPILLRTGTCVYRYTLYDVKYWILVSWADDRLTVVSLWLGAVYLSASPSLRATRDALGDLPKALLDIPKHTTYTRVLIYNLERSSRHRNILSIYFI